MPFLKYKRFKLKLRVFLAGHSVTMVTYCVTKIMPTCSPMIGQFFDNMIVVQKCDDVSTFAQRHYEVNNE